MTDLLETILTVPIFLLAISCHEFCHAVTAVYLGDPTPRHQGRLTLSFMAHLDWIGVLMLLILGIGWAKPVEVNSRNFRHPQRDMVLVSLAGPAANLALAVLFAVALRVGVSFLPSGAVGITIVMFILIGMRLNLLLAFFNLVPVPPLDGAKVIAPLLPVGWRYALQGMERWGFIIIYALFRYAGLGGLLHQLVNIVSGILLS